MKRLGTLMLAAGMLAMAACAGGISRQVRSQVTFGGSFSELQQTPDRYMGETVLLGGKVIDTQARDGGTEITVLQLELDRWDRPQDNDRSQGRFIVQTAQFLDPALYPQGTLVTAVGRLTGSALKPIGEMAYRHPLVELLEIKKWPAQNQQPYPRFQFGIGVGTHF